MRPRPIHQIILWLDPHSEVLGGTRNLLPGASAEWREGRTSTRSALCVFMNHDD